MVCVCGTVALVCWVGKCEWVQVGEVCGMLGV